MSKYLCADCVSKEQCNGEWTMHCASYKKEPMTNEEWFCGLSTEEKAEFFHNIVIRAMQATWDGKKPDFPAYLYDWNMWLKQPHKK